MTRILLSVLVLAGSLIVSSLVTAQELDVPRAVAPVLDGEIGEEEWKGGVVRPLVGGGEARFQRDEDRRQAVALGGEGVEGLGERDPHRLQGAAKVAGLTAQLIHEGAINGRPFLQEGYLEKLDDSRKKHLADALGETGPLLTDGSVNRRLATAVSEQAGLNSEAGRFAMALLYRWVARYPAAPPSADSQAVEHVLGLSGLDAEALDPVYTV